ncbi:MAG: hypothetical protein U1E45_19730 [Geminicoccaceae bacterium]
MEAWQWWVGIAIVLALALLLLRHSGFRLGAEAFGAKVELEGKGGGEAKPEAAAKKAPGGTGSTSVRATGDRSIAVGGDAYGNFVTGDGNRVDQRSR